MKFIKRLCIITLVLILSVLGSVFYAFKIEPYRVKVSNVNLQKNQTDTVTLKVVQISDTHIKSDYTYKNLQKVVEKINAQNPDIVVFTGDLYDAYANYNDDANIIETMGKIKAKHAKIAIWGNRDYGGGAARVYADVMQKSGFILLTNQSEYITLENGKTVLITGLDDSLMGTPHPPDNTDFLAADYTILLNHEPDASDKYVTLGYDIILSGHSHGGQFNVPFLPYVNRIAVKTTLLSSKYSAGMYNIGDTKQQKLYVNTGIGTTHISARFGVVPQVTVFNISV